MRDRRRRGRWFLAVALTLLTRVALAWNDTGHMLVDLAAFAALDGAERRAVLELLAAHPRFRADFLALMPKDVARADASARGRWLFAMAGTWPDLARGFEHVDSRWARERLVARHHRGRWHYVNFPVFLGEPFDVRANVATDPRAARRPEQMNLLQALAWNLDLLRSAAPAAERAVALTWVMHLTGDVHQPLHAVALYDAERFPTGDRGGNDVPVGDANLHALWDRALGFERDVETLSRALDEWPDPVATVDEPTVEGWARESRELAASIVYTPAIRAAIATDQTVALAPRARDAATEVAATRVQLAGQRLARLLGGSMAAMRNREEQE